MVRTRAEVLRLLSALIACVVLGTSTGANETKLFSEAQEKRAMARTSGEHRLLKGDFRRMAGPAVGQSREAVEAERQIGRA